MARPAGQLGEHPQRVLRLRHVPLIRRHVDRLVDVRPGGQAARVDGVDDDVGAHRRARQLGELRHQIRIRERRLLTKRVALGFAGALLLLFLASVRERIEVVPVADIDERLAAIVDLGQVSQQVVRRAEGHVRSMPHLRQAGAAARRGEHVARRKAVAHDLAGRLIEPVPVVGQVDLDRRGAGREDAEQVASVDQPLRDPVEQLTHARRLAGFEMRVVDEDEEDAPRGVVRGPRRRKDEALARPFGGPRDVEHTAAMRQRERDQRLPDPVLVELELVGFRSARNRPRPSRTVADVVTSSTPTLIRPGWPSGVCTARSCARGAWPATSTQTTASIQGLRPGWISDMLSSQRVKTSAGDVQPEGLIRGGRHGDDGGGSTACCSRTGPKTGLSNRLTAPAV